MKSIASALLLALFAVTGADAACTYPKAPTNIPDGNTATKEDMLAAQKDVRTYNDTMTEYLGCIAREHEETLKAMDGELQHDASAADRDALERRKKELTRKQDQKHNAAVDELNAVADRFNQEVRVYQKKQSG